MAVYYVIRKLFWFFITPRMENYFSDTKSSVDVKPTTITLTDVKSLGAVFESRIRQWTHNQSSCSFPYLELVSRLTDTAINWEYISTYLQIWHWYGYLYLRSIPCYKKELTYKVEGNCWYIKLVGQLVYGTRCFHVYVIPLQITGAQYSSKRLGNGCISMGKYCVEIMVIGREVKLN